MVPLCGFLSLPPHSFEIGSLPLRLGASLPFRAWGTAHPSVLSQSSPGWAGDLVPVLRLPSGSLFEVVTAARRGPASCAASGQAVGSSQMYPRDCVQPCQPFCDYFRILYHWNFRPARFKEVKAPVKSPFPSLSSAALLAKSIVRQGGPQISGVLRLLSRACPCCLRPSCLALL